MASTMGTSWHRVDEVPGEGRVSTAIVDGRSIAVTPLWRTRWSEVELRGFEPLTP